MLRYASLFLLVCAAFVAGQRPAPAQRQINYLIDRQLQAHNDVLTNRQIEDLTIPAGKTDDIEFSEGVQHHANTMRRTGDGFAVRADEEDSTSYKYRIGFQDLGFSFDSITFPGGRKVAKPSVAVGPHSILFEFTVRNAVGCSVRMDEYKYERLEGLQGTNLSPEDMALLRPVFMAHLNSLLEKKKPGVEKHLQTLCEPGQFPTN